MGYHWCDRYLVIVIIHETLHYCCWLGFSTALNACLGGGYRGGCEVLLGGGASGGVWHGFTLGCSALGDAVWGGGGAVLGGGGAVLGGGGVHVHL